MTVLASERTRHTQRTYTCIQNSHSQEIKEEYFLNVEANQYAEIIL